MPKAAPPPNGPQIPAPLWASGRLRLRLLPPGGGPGRVLQIARPFALIGRGAGADLRINDPGASIRHTYLHLDSRGLFGVDLASRTGTRFRDAPLAAAWLRPGDLMEIADHQIELLEAHAEAEAPPVNGLPRLAPTLGVIDPSDPLGDTGNAPLARLTLFPHQPPWEPQEARSELLFLGEGAYCAIRVEGESIARIHAVLVRTTTAAYLVDLSGGRTRINGRPVPRAAPLRESDVLALGSARFEVRIRPAEAIDQLHPDPDQDRDRRRPAPPLPVERTQALPIPRDASGWGFPELPAPRPAEAQGAMLAWLVQAVQAGQGEALRRQGEFQHALTDMVHQICLDNASMLHEHLQRMESIHAELAGLRDEIQRRLGPSAPPMPPMPPPPPPLRIAPVEPPTDTGQSTSWLIDRVHRLEEENRSTWRDLLGRLGGQDRRAP
ncbi:hypothetical protein BH23PLA1_BH23PLA1_04830 [soil metagenome]